MIFQFAVTASTPIYIGKILNPHPAGVKVKLKSRHQDKKTIMTAIALSQASFATRRASTVLFFATNQFAFDHADCLETFAKLIHPEHCRSITRIMLNNFAGKMVCKNVCHDLTDFVGIQSLKLHYDQRSLVQLSKEIIKWPDHWIVRLVAKKIVKLIELEYSSNRHSYHWEELSPHDIVCMDRVELWDTICEPFFVILDTIQCNVDQCGEQGALFDLLRAVAGFDKDGRVSYLKGTMLGPETTFPAVCT